MELRLMGFTTLLTVCLIATAKSHAQDSRANPRSARQNVTTNTGASFEWLKQAEKLSCRTNYEVARRVEICAKPMMDLVQGTVEKWLRTEEDAMRLCDSYLGSERCVKDTSRKCGKGLEKAIISTVAQSVQRVRRRECTRDKSAGILKTTMCIENHQAAIHDWMASATGRLSAIELQTKEPEKKLNAVCCMTRDMEIELKALLDPFCPAESALINRLYKGILGDAIDLACHNPKCNNYMKDYKVTKSQNSDGIISIILRIVFSLSNSTT